MAEHYSNNNIYQDTSLFALNRAGCGRTERGFLIQRDKAYPFCNIHYITRGQMLVEFRGACHKVRKGQLFILPPFEAHKYQSVQSDDLELNWVEFSCGSMGNLLKEVLKTGDPVFDLTASNKTNRYIRYILQVLRKQGFPKYSLSKALFSILVTLTEARDRQQSRAVSRADLDRIQIVLQYIDGNIQNSLCIKELAKVSGYSPSYFEKLFSKAVGATPARYILNRRIALAKDRLCQEDIKLQTLAAALGFCDTSHFIRVFKKAEGVTPAEFKRQTSAYTASAN